MFSEKDKMIHAATAWTQKKSVENFLLLWRYGFRTENPFFKLWRIFRNTVNGRYAEIAEKKYLAW